MADEKKVLDKGELKDRVLTHLSFAAIISYIGKRIFDRLTEEGVEKITKKAEEAVFGKTTKSADAVIDDESFWLMAVLDDSFGSLSATALNFEAELRRKNENLAKAMVLYVAGIVQKQKKEIKKTTGQQGGQKGQKGGSQVSEVSCEYSSGIALAGKFLKVLLAVPTFKGRVAFLKARNIHSLISKPGMLDPAIAKAKKLGKDGIEKGQELASDAKEKVSEHLRANAVDRKRSSEAALERAKTARDEAVERFRAGRR